MQAKIGGKIAAVTPLVVLKEGSCSYATCVASKHWMEGSCSYANSDAFKSDREVSCSYASCTASKDWREDSCSYATSAAIAKIVGKVAAATPLTLLGKIVVELSFLRHL